MWGYEIDCDEDSEKDWRSHPIAEIERRIRYAGLNPLVYPTGAHTESETNARVLLAYGRARDPSEHERFVSRVVGLLDGLVDPACFTLAASLFRPQAGQDSRARYDHRSGRWLDTCGDLDAGAMSRANVNGVQSGKAPASKPKGGRKRKPCFLDDENALARSCGVYPQWF